MSRINFSGGEWSDMATEYFAPANQEEALEVLVSLKESVVLIAGGTDLMVKLNRKAIKPGAIMSLAKLGLSGIKSDGVKVTIGAATTLSEIVKSPVIKDSAPVLHDAVSKMASVAIRNSATLGGNLCNASPAADSAPPLMVLDAVLVARGPKGERRIPISQFFLGPGKTVLAPDEILTAVEFPKVSPSERTAYVKLGRRKSESLSVVSVAALLSMEGELCKKARIALGAVAPTPVLATAAARFLEGKKVGEPEVKSAADMVLEQIAPISDVRSSAWYRNQGARAVTIEALGRCLPPYVGAGPFSWCR